MRKPIPSAVSDEQINGLVLQLRGHKVMLDTDLAVLYGVPTKRLNEAVKRNKERFPEDFMFQLSAQEARDLLFQNDKENQHDTNLRSQIATSSLYRVDNKRNSKSNLKISSAHGGRRELPYAFTEQGIAMLSSVLRSQRAIEVNIAIMRAFVSLRGMMRSQESIKHELAALKRQYKDHDDQIKAIFLMIDEIMAPTPAKKRKIGYIHGKD